MQNSEINNVIDCEDIDFKAFVSANSMSELKDTLLPFLTTTYKTIVQLKDIVIDSQKRGVIKNAEAVEIVSRHYTLLLRIEDRISYVKEVLDTMEQTSSDGVY